MNAVYVASPLGFTEAGRHFYTEALLPAIQRAGLEANDPWADGSLFEEAAKMIDAGARREAFRRANESAGATNERLIDRSDGVLAVLDGADVDSGTASEVGWAAAKGLPIVGWRNDLRVSGDNEASIVNLQVEYFIRRSGGSIERSLTTALRARGGGPHSVSPDRPPAMT